MAEMHRRTVEALALAIEAKDRVTGGHLRRVQRYAVAIGRRMGCEEKQIKALEIGALLHDIGKIAVPEALLLKPGRLTRQEFHQVAVHPQIGAEILAAVNFPFPVAELVHSHHERWDGSGYPRGLKGAEIPLTARILSVADCLDALISDRPYRSAFSLEEAMEVLRRGRGKTFDSAVVDALLEVLPQVGNR
jgi:putative nucleotidyltransferase with HDIG domain